VINHLVSQRYEVVEKVGISPIFAVYKARDLTASHVVALKTVQSPYADDPAFVEALHTGFTAAAKLRHPNITAFLEWGEEESAPYAVFEFVRGINLKERIRRIAPFTLSVAVDFACAITEALHYAHSVGIPHGDLRPQNIIVSPEGTLKVTDFGMQQALMRSEQAQQEVLLRAAPYHAPELSLRQPGTVSGDIYALGAILYEMVTGTPLYAADSPEAIADQHAFGAIPSPRTINPGVPRAVEGIILKCLQKRPEQRYRVAADLLNDLKSVRDALRFGKSLSWSPIELEDSVSSVRTALGAPAGGVPSRVPALEPVANVTASSHPATMTAQNRLRAQGERISIYLKVAIGTVTAVIIAALIGLVAIWMSLWATPRPVTVPQFVGKPIEEVRRMADAMKVRLKEHTEFSDRPPGIVYESDQEPGAKIRPNHIINVFYSKGPKYVDVPSVVGMTREDAEKRLKEAGLTIGKILTEFSDRVPTNAVIRQSAKKRVFHDAAIDLAISDGPKPEYANLDNGPQNDTANGPENAPDNGSSPDQPNVGADNTIPTPEPPPGQPERTFDRTISIPNDGKGVRQVKIIYKDAQGWHDAVPVIDEPHNEGDKIPISFIYYGKEITMRIYYDEKQVWERSFDPQASRKRIQ
jgi:serine/threonine-protein kinase